ncbi:MAG: 30S ribosomal protein S19e [Candidatus Woesearchaeota archaeon]|nr:30S ribosomal protein S19e [Candidatus Woesearchaeota archaeon]
MASIYDVSAEKLIKKAAEELKKDIKMPQWAKFVKTGAGKERPPIENDWWYMRAASILRKIYINGPIGVEKLRKKYSSKKNMGHKPERVYPGSGKIIRTILQDLEKSGYIKFAEKKVHKGRIITPKGKKFLDSLSKNLK